MPRRYRPGGDRGPTLAADEGGRILDYPAALTPLERLRGAHGLEVDCGVPFRWLEPDAALRLSVPPGAYRLQLHMGRLAPMWAGRLALALDGRAIPERARRLDSGTLSQVLLPEDFAPGAEHWLQLRCEPVDRSLVQPAEVRALGVPFFGFSLGVLSPADVRERAEA